MKFRLWRYIVVVPPAFALTAPAVLVQRPSGQIGGLCPLIQDESVGADYKNICTPTRAAAPIHWRQKRIKEGES